MVLNKEKQYTAIYIPEKLVEEKETTYWALLDIDSNFSKLICLILRQVKNLAKFIYSVGKNYRHYDWIIIIRDKQSKVCWISTEKGIENEKSTKVQEVNNPEH